LFSGDAVLSRIDGTQSLFVLALLHQAVVDVNKEGTVMSNSGQLLVVVHKMNCMFYVADIGCPYCVLSLGLDNIDMLQWRILFVLLQHQCT
jgi:hypothetical protein